MNSEACYIVLPQFFPIGSDTFIITSLQDFFSYWHMVYRRLDGEGLGISDSCVQQEEEILLCPLGFKKWRGNLSVVTCRSLLNQKDLMRGTYNLTRFSVFLAVPVSGLA